MENTFGGGMRQSFKVGFSNGAMAFLLLGVLPLPK